MSAATRRRTLTVEMTSGSLWKNILLFSLPLMATQVLEVLFNLSDVAIAGKYAYNTYIALGSVGSTTTLVSLFTGLCSSAWAAASTWPWPVAWVWAATRMWSIPTILRCSSACPPVS